MIDSHLASHKEELRKVLEDVQQSIKVHPKGLKTHPPRYARYLWSWLREEPVAHCEDVRAGAGHVVRQIHDFYGWKAKDKADKRGVCSGALYRSARYLAIPPEARSGSKREQNVHIEHTVPVAVLVKALKHHISSFPTPGDLHGFLLRHSVCAALSYEEKGLLSNAGVSSSRNPAFEDDGQVVGEYPFPFMRYQEIANQDKNFRLFNVVSGEEIEIAKFTFADHKATLDGASQLVMLDACGNMIYSLELFNRS